MEDIEDVFEGWLERPTEENQGKGWLKKSFTKKWKKVYCALRKYGSSDQAFIQWFDKEDNWRRQMPKGTLELFPRYKVIKKTEFRGKQCVFEVSNDADMYILAAESESVLDLWVIQLQMQTRLNPRVAGKTFRIKCCGSKQMQRIGGKDQHCLLHISKWGVTLALERTRAVLAQWPLTTIRNYESMDRGEFSFEAGRRSPMGEGKYTFFTQVGEDNRIFDTIDSFTTSRLAALQGIPAAAAGNSEEDVSQAYDQLRFSVLNIPAASFDGRDGSMRAVDMAGSAPRCFEREEPSSYDHIGRSDSLSSGRSIGSFSTSMDPSMSYSSLDRHSSFGSQTEGIPQRRENYDTLDHARSMANMSIKEGSRGLGRTPSGYSHISTSSIRGTPDDYKRDPHMCPLEISPESEQKLTTSSSTSPTSPVSSSPGFVGPQEFSDSGEYKSDGCLEGTTSSSTLMEEPIPPPLPVRGSTLPGSKKSKSKQPNEKGNLLKVNGENDNHICTTSTSPNFVYLTSSYSKSVEVLPALYATVDKEKKKRDREKKKKAEKAKKFERSRKKSRSYERLSDSPKFNSLSFTPFSYKGLADMDFDSLEGSTSLESPSSTESFTLENEIVSAKAPKTERVSMAFKGTLERNGEVMGQGRVGETYNSMTSSSAPNSREMATLHSTLSQSPRFGKRKGLTPNQEKQNPSASA